MLLEMDAQVCITDSKLKAIFLAGTIVSGHHKNGKFLIRA